ncbi:MAG TPA: damage-inducible protein CinA, partial [Acidimicrobiaceae bacterium]|nr:damage-inducible protein CinA [Acidimicrobiaceae bacterium]
LAASGIDSHWQTKVGDNWDRIADSLRLAVSRSDAVIVSGGLGPTPDDITREVLAGLMGVELVADPVIEQRIREMFGRHGRDMPE